MSRPDTSFSPHSDNSVDKINHHSRVNSFRSHLVPKCVICGELLNVSEQATGKACSRIPCKNQYVREQAQAELRRQNGLSERALAIEKSLEDSNRIPADPSRPRGLLPSNQRRLTGLPKRQRQVFVDRLMGIISQAAAIRYGNAELQDEGVGYETPTEMSDTHLAVLGNGCAVCRGHCCSQGSGHAFIHVETVLGHMEQNPKQRPRDVLEAYVSYIGDKTYEDSCVYHADSGCTLPREMRSKVCNGYLCKGLNEMLDRLESSGSSQALVVSVSDYYQVEADESSTPATCAAVVDAQGVEPFPVEALSADATQTEHSSADVASTAPCSHDNNRSMEA